MPQMFAQETGLIGSSITNPQQDIDVAFHLVASLKACAHEKDNHKGSRLHTYIIKFALLDTNVFVGSSLVTMYAKCGAIEKAQLVFDEISAPDTVVWNALIAGYAQLGHGEAALHRFEQMQSRGLYPDAFTFVCALKACASLGASEKGQELHNLIAREQLLETNMVVASALIDMYVKCGKLEKAQGVFDELPFQNVVVWNSLIVGYVAEGLFEDAFRCYKHIQGGQTSPDTFTYSCILKACGSIGDLERGEEVCALIEQKHLRGSDIVLDCAIVDMYAKCGALEKAQKVFDELHVRDAVLWNALISGYTQHGHGGEALKRVEEMQYGGFSPTTSTFVCALKACASIGGFTKGQEMHAQILREGWPKRDILVVTALIDMYVKCGAVDKAQELCCEFLDRDSVLWTVIIKGYAQQRLDKEALRCYEHMQLEGFSPDAVTFSCVLQACSSLGIVCRAQKIHTEIVQLGVEETCMDVGTALVTMYADCGMLLEGQELFDKLPVRDAVTWGVLMLGYAQLGDDGSVFNLFSRMVQEGKEPDLVTFATLINTCCHGGLLEKGQRVFEMSMKFCGITLVLDHHVCMIDIFCRTGHLDMAVSVIEEMSLDADSTVWHIVLSACRNQGNLKLGRWFFENAVRFEDKDVSAYCCMSNIFAESENINLEESTGW